MNFFSQNNRTLFFSSISEISEELWTDLNIEKNVYFEKSFLKAIENNHPDIKFLYLILIDEKGKTTAFASIQIINFYIDTVKNDWEFFIRKIKNIGRKLYIFPVKKPLKLLICGNTFVSGEHGIYIKPTQDKKKIVKELAKSIVYFVKSKKTKIDAFLLKDFVKESLFITDALKDYQYHPFSVEPNMVLRVNHNWLNFDDYLADMKTKFRVKARKAFELSKPLKIEEVTNQNIREQLPKMTSLYQKVSSKASFNLSNFNLETYSDLKSSFEEKYILKTFWLGDKMVGFMSGILNKNTLDAHFVGINYELNRSHAIYQRMLYEYVKIAIDKKLEIINFGRTASEIKSSVGAIPQDLTMYLRHKKNLTNKILKLFLLGVQPTPFQQKLPFKK